MDSQPKTARIAASIVGLVVVSLIGLLAFAGPGGGSEAGALVGNRAPKVAGTTLSGDQFNIDDWRGSWVLVNFFATTCPGCVQEHPDLIELSEWGKTRGDVQIVAVVFNDSAEAVAQFFELRGGDWPVLDEPSVAVDYSVAQIPETFLVSPAGQVVLYVEGEVRSEAVIEVIEARS